MLRNVAESWEEIEDTEGDKSREEEENRDGKEKDDEYKEEGSMEVITEGEETPLQKRKDSRIGLRRKKSIMVIVTSDDEEEEDITHTENEAMKEKKGQKKDRRKIIKNKGQRNEKEYKQNDSIDLTHDMEEEEDTEDMDEKRKQGVGKDRIIKGKRKEARSEIEYTEMTTQEIRDYAIMLLEDAETVRLKTETMQGGLNGILKDRIVGLRGVIECLVKKLEDKGDTVYYKTKNSELMAVNKHLNREIEKAEKERSLKEQEIESYRRMYEEADNKYVEAEKRIHKMHKYGSTEGKSEGKVGEQVSIEEINMRYAEERMDIGEEFSQTASEFDDKRGPIMRPPKRGKSQVLTLPKKFKTPLGLTRGQEESGAESSPRTVTSGIRTRLKKTHMRYEEPEKEKKKGEISNSEEEMDAIKRQIEALEEKKRMEEGRKMGRGKPRIINEIRILPSKDSERDRIVQEK